ncbi:uncharacterized protein LOC131594766 isoform X1 [Vicia villosa]|uniref:uncharacterized protein LOC131594766 isoform X1 n=1 Tax=Vicia villosa TaxID=3911 RepID=UPI00273C7FF8|nr:uncharacterized protein LOC131594766 isoform X1 [Vicia villosa]XP_058722953.1 uncharacterized protein LOC131594766 isoform X1 [Vicia villosa]XP_058722954.1 uncharacterized protein LOC131594766 isoform X1 [Vicia villosa]XP_058722955.1 uncharacterized protein LOC131594766 isoform X1 [Vicia villosa]XP_058722956.1 uncharacterized protein LOC131594766 isoform X1 [Vicia villosa]XP_058722957.1 uncharacterized protein LOC131594766 isoform X1 [Vicia villosa]XP_058722958.1 uncharacterized protein LO
MMMGVEGENNRKSRKKGVKVSYDRLDNYRSKFDNDTIDSSSLKDSIIFSFSQKESHRKLYCAAKKIQRAWGSTMVGEMPKTVPPHLKQSIAVHRIVTMPSLQNELRWVLMMENPGRVKEGDRRANLSLGKLGEFFNLMGLTQVVDSYGVQEKWVCSIWDPTPETPLENWEKNCVDQICCVFPLPLTRAFIEVLHFNTIGEKYPSVPYSTRNGRNTLLSALQMVTYAIAKWVYNHVKVLSALQMSIYATAKWVHTLDGSWNSLLPSLHGKSQFQYRKFEKAMKQSSTYVLFTQYLSIFRGLLDTLKSFISYFMDMEANHVTYEESLFQYTNYQSAHLQHESMINEYMCSSLTAIYLVRAANFVLLFGNSITNGVDMMLESIGDATIVRLEASTKLVIQVNRVVAMDEGLFPQQVEKSSRLRCKCRAGEIVWVVQRVETGSSTSEQWDPGGRTLIFNYCTRRVFRRTTMGQFLFQWKRMFFHDWVNIPTVQINHMCFLKPTIGECVYGAAPGFKIWEFEWQQQFVATFIVLLKYRIYGKCSGPNHTRIQYYEYTNVSAPTREEASSGTAEFIKQPKSLFNTAGYNKAAATGK